MNNDDSKQTDLAATVLDSSLSSLQETTGLLQRGAETLALTSEIDQKRGTVVVIDQDSFLRSYYRELLEERHYLVVSLSTPEMLFDQIIERPIDLLLIEIAFDTSSGLDLLKKLRQHDVFRSIPCILVTDGVAGLTLSSIYALGEMYVFGKAGISPDTVIDKVDSLIKDKHKKTASHNEKRS